MYMLGPKARCPTPNTQEVLACCQREHSNNSDTDLIVLQREPDNYMEKFMQSLMCTLTASAFTHTTKPV